MTEQPSVPHSMDAEQSILGALLQDNHAIDRMGDLDELAFFAQTHQEIYRAIRKQSASGKSWDVITVASMLEGQGKLESVGGLMYIGSLAREVPSSANIRRYADIVREHYTRRRIMAVAVELNELVANKCDVAEAMDKAQSSLMAITEGVQMDEPRNIGDILMEHMNLLEHRLSGETKGIPTGIEELDAILNGGWHRGQVIVEAGRPSMGKTALALHSAIYAAQKDYGVLCLSMEMVSAELADRAIAATGKIHLGKILTAKLNEEEWGRVSAGTGRLQDLPLHVLDKPGLTFYAAATYARRHKRKHGLDVLVLDYLQLMAGADDDKRHAQIEEITRNLKTLAKELNIAIILLSQLSRKTDNARRPKLSDLRDSGAIEQDADVVLFIHREEVDNPDTQWKDYADIYIAKNRQGALGRVGVTYIGHQVRFDRYDGPPPDWNEKPKARGMA